MEITDMRAGYLLLEDGDEAPPFCIRAPQGQRACHWTFVRKLFDAVGGELAAPQAVKDQMQELVQERKALLAMKDVEPDMSHAVEFLHPDRQPYPYQRQGIAFLSMARRALLADDVGLGKTVQSIGTILFGFLDRRFDQAVVLAPSSVKYQWRDEFEKFTSTEKFPELAVQVITGDKRKRELQYRTPADVLIMSHDVFRRDVGMMAQQDWWRPSRLAIVIDEANAIKNRSTKIAKAVKQYTQGAALKLALTATPIENKLHDLYSICEWLDPTIFPGLKWFEREYCNIINIRVRRGRGHFVLPKITGYKNLDDARQRMAHVYIRRTARDVGAQLPEVITNTLRLDMGTGQAAAYKAQAARIKAMKEDTPHVAVIGEIVKLREICDSPGLVGGKHSDSAKLDEIARMAAELPEDEKVVVFSEFKKMADAVVARLKDYRPLYIHGSTPDLERQTMRRTFEETDTRFMVMTTAGERGLNLQVAGILINVDLPYNPARLKQRIGRIWRLGSEHATVRIINMVMAGTFEARVLDTLSEKAELFETIFKPDGVDLLGDPIGKMSSRQLKRLI